MSGTAGSRSILRRLAGWPLLTALALVAFALGYAGFAAALGSERSASDVAYLTLQLFTVESGNAAGPSPPVMLQVARLLAPATTAYALGRTLVRVFRDEIDRWRLKRRKGHTVVVGLGWLGLAFVERLAGSDRPVIAVSLGLDDEAVASVRRWGVSVVLGDARDPAVLRDARVDRADHIVVLAGGDETNAEIALTIVALFRDRLERSVTCSVHIRDPHLCHLLRTTTLADPHGAGLRIEFFNVAEEAAGIMLDEHAAFVGIDRTARVGVIGDNDTAAAILSEAARLRAMSGSTPLTVVHAGSTDMVQRVSSRYPGLRASADIETILYSGGPLSPPAIDRLSHCETVFVCLDEDVAAIGLTLELTQRIPGVPVVVALGEWSGLAAMMSTGSTGSGSIHPFLVFDRVLEPDMLIAGVGEKLARTVHAHYLEERRRDGVSDDDPALARWRDLNEEYRASSRAQAAHLGTKLRAIGCGLAPLADWGAPHASLTDGEIELLAEMEHDRFVAERRAAGWSDGPRNVEAKTSPYLVSWEQLVDEGGERVRDLDRAAVRAIPALAARAGYRLVRASDVAKDLRP